MSTLILRPVKPEDNKLLAKVLRDVLIEMGVPKVGTAYEDESLDRMYETYDKERCAYFVVEEDGRLLGGAGIAPLTGEKPTICELQKMYFLSEVRGRGIGYQMMQKCLEFAKNNEYTHCYLETMPYMESARKLYRKVKFEPLAAPMGDTGHYSCKEWMLKTL
ncbi:GNAT family N-acetyltransferase [Aquimarina intermedia]|uniref:Putative acetyltransferase n=1 Tax=Aquimarina intermedia TaxID=350814 RepID=A0A5S5BYN7_9FLAO|nr:GNAT family N-acetyltransferase [Aquimarina intermedia]TYP72281.1 putative acetyltransferase [Aquimarina intermedia]